MLQAKIVYLFTTSTLTDSKIAQLGADMMRELPMGTPIPDNCRSVPVQVAAGSSRAQLEKALGAKGNRETGCARSMCVVTRGTEQNAEEGFFVGF